MWSYERPYPAMAEIAVYLAFYANRIDKIEETRFELHRRSRKDLAIIPRQNAGHDRHRVPEQARQAEPTARSATDRSLIAIGILTAAGGLYFALVGIEAVPPPSRINGPIWLALFVGVVFLATGISVIVRGLSGADDRSGDLPDDAPAWMKTVYWLDSVIATAGLAAHRHLGRVRRRHATFQHGRTIAGPLGEGIGRTVFGLGAIITWLIVLAFARAGAKKIFGKK